MISCSNAPQSLPNKQTKNKTCRVVIKYPNKNWTPRNASWTSDSISKPKPAWAVKFHPVLRGTKLSGRCVSYPKMHCTHLARFSSVRGSCTEWGLSCGTMWWHQLLNQKTRSLVRPSGKAAAEAGARPGNIKDFFCARAWISVQWREGASSQCDRLKPALALVLLKIMWWPVPNSAGNQLWRFICTRDHLSNS